MLSIKCLLFASLIYTSLPSTIYSKYYCTHNEAPNIDDPEALDDWHNQCDDFIDLDDKPLIFPDNTIDTEKPAFIPDGIGPMLRQHRRDFINKKHKDYRNKNQTKNHHHHSKDEEKNGENQTESDVPTDSNSSTDIKSDNVLNDVKTELTTTQLSDSPINTKSEDTTKNEDITKTDDSSIAITNTLPSDQSTDLSADVTKIGSLDDDLDNLPVMDDQVEDDLDLLDDATILDDDPIFNSFDPFPNFSPDQCRLTSDLDAQLENFITVDAPTKLATDIQQFHVYVRFLKDQMSNNEQLSQYKRFIIVVELYSVDTCIIMGNGVKQILVE